VEKGGGGQPYYVRNYRVKVLISRPASCRQRIDCQHGYVLLQSPLAAAGCSRLSAHQGRHGASRNKVTSLHLIN
jgi:hypothetical protein